VTAHHFHASSSSTIALVLTLVLILQHRKGKHLQENSIARSTGKKYRYFQAQMYRLIKYLFNDDLR
jgi:hypothetical protein